MASNADRTAFILAWMRDEPPQPLAHYHASRHVIYFYGKHYPLIRAASEEDAYYVNETPYSNSTTSAQKSARAALEAEGYSLASYGASELVALGMDEFSLWMKR